MRERGTHLVSGWQYLCDALREGVGDVALAAATGPAPWSAPAARTAEAGGLFVNAIHEFVSMRPVDRPAALPDDAAHLLSPITGSGAGWA